MSASLLLISASLCRFCATIFLFSDQQSSFTENFRHVFPPRLFCAFLVPLFLRTLIVTSRHCSWLPASVFLSIVTTDQDGLCCDGMAFFSSVIVVLLLFLCATRTKNAVFFPSCFFLGPDDIGAHCVCTCFRNFSGSMSCPSSLYSGKKGQVFLQVPIRSSPFLVSTPVAANNSSSSNDHLGVCPLQKGEGRRIF